MLNTKNISITPSSTSFDFKSFYNQAKNANLVFSEKIITRFISSLCTKPFVILTGLSGSGKTKLAQSFVQWICDDENQYKIVPVGADWTNREPLLGYPNALNQEEYISPDNGVLNIILEANKSENKGKPYFLILDEMNLSHVERYFADFLSTMESNDKILLHSDISGKSDIPSFISLPKNLFIIGTVNIDETTYMFSPKVLDRANTIEFRITDKEIKSFLENPKKPNMLALQKKGVNIASDFLLLSQKNDFTNKKNKDVSDTLFLFFKELKKSGAEFGYRTASEIDKLLDVLGEVENKLTENEKLDIAIMQKLLPKIHGSRRKLDPILTTLGSFCIESKDIKKDYFNKIDEIDYENDANIKFKLSLEKIIRMYKGAIDNGFASYAEA